MRQFRFENKFSESSLYVKNDESLKEYKYNISGYISMNKMFKEKGISYSILKCFIVKLSLTGRQIEKEHKNINGMILDPEYIFFRIIEGTGGVKILYYPDAGESEFESGMLYLGEYIIKHVDYRDERAVRLAYDFYKRLYQGVYIFEDLLR